MNKCSLSLASILSDMPRPIRHRKMYQPPMAKGFRPIGMVGRSSREVVLLLEEYEAIKLSDYKGFTHAQAAKQMEISRPTFTRIYAKARKKVAEAFVENRTILIEGGNVNLTENWYRCKDCDSVFSNSKIGEELHCFSCNSKNIILLNRTDSKPMRKYRPRDYSSGFCICPSCGVKIGHGRGKPCREMICPKCGGRLIKDMHKGESEVVKIAISCSNSGGDAKFNAKFGRSPFFALVENGEVEFVKNPAADMSGGAGPRAVEFLAKKGVNKVVSSRFGAKAKEALMAFSLEMEWFDDENMTIEEIKNFF